MIMNYKKIFMIIYQITNVVGMMLNIQVEILKNLLKYFLMKPHNIKHLLNVNNIRHIIWFIKYFFNKTTII